MHEFDTKLDFPVSQISGPQKHVPTKSLLSHSATRNQQYILYTSVGYLRPAQTPKRGHQAHAKHHPEINENTVLSKLFVAWELLPKLLTRPQTRSRKLGLYKPQNLRTKCATHTPSKRRLYLTTCSQTDSVQIQVSFMGLLIHVSHPGQVSSP